MKLYLDNGLAQMLKTNNEGLDKLTPKNISELDGGGPATQCFSRAVKPAKALTNEAH